MIASYLGGIRTPLQFAFRKGGKHGWLAAAKIFERGLSRFGNVNVMMDPKVSNFEYPPGVYNPTGERVTLIINPDQCERWITNDQLWDNFIENLSTTTAHELTHHWQNGRRGGPNSSMSMRDYKYYYDDPYEIAAWAHDVVNEFTPEKLRWFLERSFDGTRSVKLSLFRNYSKNFRFFEDGLAHAPPKVKRNVMNRFFRKIAEISGLV